jgi:sulfatase maturation enzyme AslB (radical SAM superfamily)
MSIPARINSLHPPLYNLGKIVVQHARDFTYPIREAWARSHPEELFIKNILNQQRPEDLTICRPVIGLIETNHTCNLNCPMCQMQYSRRVHGVMDLETFRMVISQLAEFLDYRGVSLHAFGEVLLNPHFAEMLDICREYRFRVSITTNGQLLNRHLETLNVNRDIISRINFSSDGATKETYEFLRFPGRFDDLVRNLDLFTAMNNSRYNKIPVQLHAVLSMVNREEIPEFFRLYARWFRPGDIIFYPLGPMSSDIMGLDTFYQKFRLPFDGFYEPAHRVCSPNQGIIFFNGDIGICCADHNGQLVYGNVKDAPISGLASSEKRLELLEKVRTDNPPGPCARCYRMKPIFTTLLNEYIHYLYLKFGPAMRWESFWNFWTRLHAMNKDTFSKTDLQEMISWASLEKPIP